MKLRRIQIAKLRSAIVMIVTMLILPVLLAACGKSEWHEVKGAAPAASTVPAQAPVAQQTAPAEPTTPAVPATTPTEAVPAKESQPVARPVPKIVPEPVARPIPKKSVKEPVVAEAPATAVPVAPIAEKQPVKQPAKPAAAKTAAKPAPAKPVAEKAAPAPKKRNAAKVSPMAKDADRYIVVQNIATQKLRVYEISREAGKANLLIFETDMINGEVEPAKTRRTVLGSYKIEKWIKFYQDNAGLFPSWYDSKLGTTPAPQSDLSAWTLARYMPEVNGKPFGLVRGAFGWYTAKIGPDAHAQWTHGTVGWGQDQDRFIQVSKAELAQFYADPRGYGCTRVENRAIAYLQDKLPTGTRLVKVYAKETIADKSLARYKDQASHTFEYALSSDEARQVNPNSSELHVQILREIPEGSVIEQGQYKVDATPTAVFFKKTAGDRNSVKIVRAEANLYDLPESSFQGEFIVDEGRFVNYKAPKELRMGGFKGEIVPAALSK